jgi:hypothetical protein
VNVAGTAVHGAMYEKGKVYVRIGPSAGDVRARVYDPGGVNFAGHIIQQP